MVCKSHDEELALWDCEFGEEGVEDLPFCEIDLPVFEVAALLGLCLQGDTSFCGIDPSVDAIQDERVCGSVTIRKVDGACGRRRRKFVSSGVVRWKSRERESATSLCFPGICSGWSVACLMNNSRAR